MLRSEVDTVRVILSDELNTKNSYQLILIKNCEEHFQQRRMASRANGD